MKNFMMRLTPGLVCTAVCLVAREPDMAQGCQRGPAAGSGTGSQITSPLSQLQGNQLAGFQQPNGFSQLAALQQQQAMAALAARRQTEATAQAARREREQADRAAQFRQIGDRFRAEDRTALAIQNYRRAMFAAPSSRVNRKQS